MRIYIYQTKTSNQKITFSSNISNEKNPSGCINRDENAVDNIIKLVEYYLEHKHEKKSKDKRLLKFRRDFKFEESSIKVSKSCKKLSSARTSSKSTITHTEVSHFSYYFFLRKK